MENHKAGEKYNIVGKEETDNLELAKVIANIMDKPLRYKMVDFHSSRPGHDLRYALCGKKMRDMGWEPKRSLRDRIKEVVVWISENPEWK